MHTAEAHTHTHTLSPGRIRKKATKKRRQPKSMLWKIRRVK